MKIMKIMKIIIFEPDLKLNPCGALRSRAIYKRSFFAHCLVDIVAESE